MSEFNHFEMIRTLQDIEANQEQHNQHAWAVSRIPLNIDLTDPQAVKQATACGTTMCAAGFTVARHGYQFDWAVSMEQHRHYVSVAENCTHPETGDSDSIENVARRILGLTEDQAQMFFWCTNTLDDLKQAALRFAREARKNADV